MVFPMLALDLLVFVSFFAVILAVRDHQRRRGRPYPPGPPPRPIIGNLLDIPKGFSWLSYMRLSKKYGANHVAARLLLTERISGDIISFRVFGRVIVVLNSIKATKDLLERRGDIYSDRAVLPICEMYVFFYVRALAQELTARRMNWEWIIPLARNTEFWRQARKLLDRGLRPGAISAYRPLQQAKARALLVNLLAKPDNWEIHLERFVVLPSASLRFS